MKNINIRTLIYLQAAIVFFIPVYLILWHYGMRPGFFSYDLMFLGYIFQRILESKCRNELDERTKYVLDKANGFCFDIAAAVLVLCGAWIVVTGKTGNMIGIIMGAGVFLIYLLRAILFSYWDRRGIV